MEYTGIKTVVISWHEPHQAKLLICAKELKNNLDAGMVVYAFNANT